jgi:23S rRNA pseudouridine955/2504/2580 synthase
VLEPLTGRTHQLRVHCAAIGTPILGDAKYGGRDAFPANGVANKLHLHARSIRLPRPGSRWLEVSAPLPPHMRDTWRFLGFDPNTEE